MPDFVRDAYIDRPPGEVWDYFVDASNIGAWAPDIVKLEKLSDGPVALGTKYKETRRIGKGEGTATLVITAFERPKLYAGTVDEKGLRGTYTYRLAPEGAGTRISLEAEMTARGLMRLLRRFIVKMMEKQDGDQLLRLKKAIES